MSERTDSGEPRVLAELRREFDDALLACRSTRDGTPVVWVGREKVRDVLRHLRSGVDRPYGMLYDLFGVDERQRTCRDGLPPADFAVVYQLLSLDRCGYVLVKVPLAEGACSVPTVSDLWSSADWYERELWDMFGVAVEGHPNLRRLLMPQSWEGHPLRKEHPARATEMPPYELPESAMAEAEAELEFVPEDWGLKRRSEGTEYMFLNVGPAHTGTHGLLRVVLQLDGERIEAAVCDIGYHHRGVEKMGERQTWHSFIPYTDRVEYLGGVMNNLPYVLAVEKLAGIEVPDRAQVIRVMMAELCRVASHLVWYGTFAMDVGQMSPVFYMFTDRERVFDILTAVCGGRMHPSWFRIGGVAQDLPDGWYGMVTDFVRYMGPRIDEFDRIALGNSILKARSVGVGAYTTEEAVDWGVTGPGLRATGCRWDFRRKMPYSGYDRFEFEVPIGDRGDVYDRARVRVEEMRQSLRIIGQCADNMPAGPYKAAHPLATPPRKEATMHDIETLITHFLSVSWGPVMPAGEAFAGVEATKGGTGYYLISDGGVTSYRTRVRTASFPHIQMVPHISRGGTVADLLAILGSVDYVLSDVDR